MTPPLLRTLLRTSVSIEALTRRLLRTLQRRTSFKEQSKNPSKSRVRLHDPLGVRPTGIYEWSEPCAGPLYHGVLQDLVIERSCHNSRQIHVCDLLDCRYRGPLSPTSHSTIQFSRWSSRGNAKLPTSCHLEV